MTCLYAPDAALPADARGFSPMQPVCARRLLLGEQRLLAGAVADNIDETRAALDAIVTLLACQFRNDGLPYAHACGQETDKVAYAYQRIVDRP
jgi:hypothetical protein